MHCLCKSKRSAHLDEAFQRNQDLKITQDWCALFGIVCFQDGKWLTWTRSDNLCQFFSFFSQLFFYIYNHLPWSLKFNVALSYLKYLVEKMIVWITSLFIRLSCVTDDLQGVYAFIYSFILSLGYSCFHPMWFLSKYSLNIPFADVCSADWVLNNLQFFQNTTFGF